MSRRLTPAVFFAGIYAAAGLGVACLGGVGHVWQGVMEQTYREEVSQVDAVMVIVAARELPPGTRIGVGDLYAVQIAPSYLPEGVYLSPEHVVGRRTTSRVLANEMVRVERLEP